MKDFMRFLMLVCTLIGGANVFAANDSAFVSQAVPIAMTAGQSYTVSITMRNSGDTTWTYGANYRMGSQAPQDNSTWGLVRTFLNTSDSILPNQQKTFTFGVTAPSAPGVYQFQWRMVQESVEWFGASSPVVTVTVSPFFPASKVSSWGVYRDYYPDSHAKLEPSIGYTRVETVQPRSGAKQSFNISAFDVNHVEQNNIEAFDLKSVLLTRLSDGAQQWEDMWVLVGTIDKNDHVTMYKIGQQIFDGQSASYAIFDTNNNFLADDGNANSYRIDVPNRAGTPYAFSSLFNMQYILETWYRVDNTGQMPVGAVFPQRQFWAAVYHVGTTVNNPHWLGGGASSRFAIGKSEAWWWSDSDASSGTFGYGAGGTCIQSDGLAWPCNYQYGSRDWHARDTSPYWTVTQWWPNTWDYGAGTLIP